MTQPFDYKYVKRPMPYILDEIFDPFATTFATTRLQTYQQQQTIAVQESGNILNVALEIPRLDRTSISVTVEKQGRQYALTVEASEIPLDSYLSDSETKDLKTYNKVFKIETSRPVALEGDLNLAYSEGVLCIQIPLQSPVQPKKATLSAKLSDLESLA